MTASPTETIPATDLRGVAVGALLGTAAMAALVFPPERSMTGAVVAGCLILVATLAARIRISIWASMAAIAFVLVQVRLSLAPGRTIEVLAALALAFGGFHVSRALSRQGARWTFAITACAVVLLALVALRPIADPASVAGSATGSAEYALGHGSFLDEGWIRAGHVTSASLGMALLIAGCCAAAHEPRGRLGRAVRVGILVIVAIMIAATGSFATWLAAGAVLWSAPRRWHPEKRRLRLTVAAAVLLAGVAGAVIPRATPSDPQSVSPILARLDLWRGAALASSRLAATGTGLASFGALHDGVRGPGEPSASNAHGSWQQAVAECGLPGAAILVAIAVWWARRVRSGDDVADRWILACLLGFAVHGLFEPSLYLPSLTIPAAILAGLVGGNGRVGDPARARASAADRIVPRAFVAVLVLAGGVVVAGEAFAKLGNGSRGPERAPWSASAHARAVAIGLERSTSAPDDRLSRWLDRLDRLDPRSATAARLRGDLARRAGRDADAWRAYARASIRSPDDPSIRRRFTDTEQGLRQAGLLVGEYDYTALESSPPRPPPRRDVWLLAIHLAAIGVVVRPPLALRAWGLPARAVLATLLLVPWGEGGRLPGTTLGRTALVTVVALALLRSAAGFAIDREELRTGRRWQAALAVIAGVTVVSGLTSPDIASSRAGVVQITTALILFALSAFAALRRPDWSRDLIRTWAVGAAGAALVVLAQRVVLAADNPGNGILAALLWGGGNRPAGDFGHPGHLGSFLAAAGLALSVSGAGARIAWGRLTLGGTLVLVGLGQGARATLVALAVGTVVAAIFAVHRNARRLLAGLTIVAGIAGSAIIVARFAVADPFKWSRIDIWKNSLDAVSARPLLGYGPGGFASFGPNFQPGIDSDLPTRFSWFFDGPHSDALGLFISFGIPGGILVLGALLFLLPMLARGARAESPDRPWAVAALVGVSALASHGLVDDFFGPRPAAMLVGAVLAGALAGRLGRLTAASRESEATARAACSSAGPRITAGVALVTMVLGFVVVPWVADRQHRMHRPDRATLIDPYGAGYWIASARLARGTARERLALADERTWRAVDAVPGSSVAWIERAECLEAALRGPLPRPDTLVAAIDAWDHVIDRAPHAVLALRSRGRLHAFRGDPVSAESDFRRALADEPNFMGARFDLIRLLRQTGRAEDARREAEVLLAAADRLRGYRATGSYERELLSFDDVDRRALQELR